jgi:hypothetical protein
MVALAGARRDLHFPQQSIHLRDGEHSPGPNRAVAGDRCGDMIELVTQTQWATQLSDFRRKIGQKSASVASPENRGYGTDEHCRRAETLDVEPHPGKLVSRGFEPVAFRLIEFDHFGDQQRLAGDCAASLCIGAGRAHAFEYQPLVRRVLVDDHQSIFGLGNDVGRCHLPAGNPKRVAWHPLDGGFCSSGGGMVEEAEIFSQARHSRERRSPVFYFDWVPACAGMTS